MCLYGQCHVVQACVASVPYVGGVGGGERLTGYSEQVVSQIHQQLACGIQLLRVVTGKEGMEAADGIESFIVNPAWHYLPACLLTLVQARPAYSDLCLHWLPCPGEGSQPTPYSFLTSRLDGNHPSSGLRE